MVRPPLHRPFIAIALLIVGAVAGASAEELVTGQFEIRGAVLRVFSSFEDENRAEHRRLAAVTPVERMRESAV